jgi:transcriptional regulator with XRE-family HTH domain
MQDVVRIGEKLKRLRERRYLTQRELAEKAGISADTIVKLEQDRWEPRLRTIRKLAEALDVHPDELTGFGRNTSTLASYLRWLACRKMSSQASA